MIMFGRTTSHTIIISTNTSGSNQIMLMVGKPPITTMKANNKNWILINKRELNKRAISTKKSIQDQYLKLETNKIWSSICNNSRKSKMLKTKRTNLYLRSIKVQIHKTRAKLSRMSPSGLHHHHLKYHHHQLILNNLGRNRFHSLSKL